MRTTTYLRLLLVVPFTIALLAPPLGSQDCVGGTVASHCIPDLNSDEEVIGVSEIVAPYNDNVSGYSATELGTSVAWWYDAVQDTYLYYGSTAVYSARITPGGDLAEAYPSASTVPDRVYQIETDHYLAPWDCDGEEPKSLSGNK
jgi:hypothetical protein